MADAVTVMLAGAAMLSAMLSAMLLHAATTAWDTARRKHIKLRREHKMRIRRLQRPQ